MRLYVCIKGNVFLTSTTVVCNGKVVPLVLGHGLGVVMKQWVTLYVLCIIIMFRCTWQVCLPQVHEKLFWYEKRQIISAVFIFGNHVSTRLWFYKEWLILMANK